MYSTLISLRSKQAALDRSGIKKVVFTKNHQAQVKALERMDDYLNPHKGLTSIA